MFSPSRSTSRSNRRTNSSKAVRLPAWASETRALSSRLGNEVTVARAALEPPVRPVLSAKAKTHLESGIFAFYSCRPFLGVEQEHFTAIPPLRPQADHCHLTRFGRTTNLAVSSHLRSIQRTQRCFCFG